MYIIDLDHWYTIDGKRLIIDVDHWRGKDISLRDSCEEGSPRGAIMSLYECIFTFIGSVYIFITVEKKCAPKILVKMMYVPLKVNYDGIPRSGVKHG